MSIPAFTTLRSLAGISERDLINVMERASSVPARDRPEFGLEVEALLRKTESNAVRHAAALALVDLDRVEAGPTLNELLSRADLAKCAGTLVYALDELNGAVSLPAILNIVENGSYEARAELLLVIGRGLIQRYSEREGQAARACLSGYAQDSDEEKAEAASLALSHLEAVKAPI